MNNKLRHKSRLDQCVEVYSSIKKSYETKILEPSPIFEKYFNGLIEKGEIMKNAYMQQRQKSEISKYDAKCDNTFRAIGHMLKAYCKIENDTLLKHAKAINKTYKEYGLEITRFDIESQLAQYGSFIKKMKEEENLDHLANLDGLPILVNQLETTVKDLLSYKMKYQHQIEITRSELSGSEAKVEFIKHLNGSFWNFILFLEAEGEEENMELCHSIFGIINRVNEVVKLRETLSKKRKKSKN